MKKSLEEDSWIKGLRVTLLEKLEPLEAAENMTETVSIGVNLCYAQT